MSEPLLKKVVRHSAYSSGGTFFAFLLAIVFAGYRIRNLGVERAGFLMLLETLVASTATMGCLGISEAGMRRMAIHFGRSNISGVRKTLSTILVVNLFIGIFIFLAILLSFDTIFHWSRLNPIYYQDARSAAMLSGLAFALRQAHDSYRQVFPALQRFDITAFQRSAFGLLSGGLGLLVLTFFPTMMAASLLLAGLALLNLVVNMHLTRTLLGRQVWPVWSRSEMREMLRFSIWTYWGNLSKLLKNGLDKIILTSLMGSAVLPFYVIGQRIVMQVHTLLAGQSEFLFPMFSVQRERNKDVIVRIEDRLRWVMALVSAILYGGIMVYAKPLLAHLISADFAAASITPFLLACVQGFFLAQSITVYRLSWAEGRALPNAVYEFANGVLVFGTSLLLAPAMGIMGVSLAQLWLSVTTLGLIYWVLRAGNRFSLNALFRPFASPVLLIMIWSAGAELVRFLMPDHALASLISNAAIGAIAVMAALMFEHHVYGRFQCVSTLLSVVRLLARSLAGRLKRHKKSSIGIA
jgi:O-antigen/teichoic acid export membrane protein